MLRGGKKLCFILVLVVTLGGPGCTTYKSHEVPFRPPASFGNMQVINGLQIAAKSYFEEKEARDAFGFNIRKAGLLPVQVVMDNGSSEEIRIVPEQSFLIDDQGNLWNLLQSWSAYERLEKSTEFSRIAQGSGKGAMLGAAGGALLGAAIGILSGENVGTATLGGAALGGAGGAALGGIGGAVDEEPERLISRDLSNRSLQNESISPGSLAHGFLFFPGESPSAKTLRLQIIEMGRGQKHTLFFNLK